MAEENIRMIDDKILCKPVEEPQQTAGGVILPPAPQDIQKPREGIVIGVGPGHRDARGVIIPMETKIGDYIIVKPGAWHDIERNGEKLFITCDRDVFMIVDNED